MKNGSKWRTKEISIDGHGKPPTFSSSIAAAAKQKQSANLSSNELSPALLAQANWTFVEKLLKVCIADGGDLLHDLADEWRIIGLYFFFAVGL